MPWTPTSWSAVLLHTHLLRPGTWHFQSSLSFAGLAQDLAAGGSSGRCLSETIAQGPSAAVFWETPPVSRATAVRPFECVLQEAPALAEPAPDPSPLRARLTQPVNTFWNLGHDAMLVAPAPPGDFAHLASFCRSASAEQQSELWRAVGLALLDWWARTERPVWTSTSGLGVAWLHVRLDQRPKYYTHSPYRAAPQAQLSDASGWAPDS